MRSTALQLPPPQADPLPSGAIVWTGGVQVLGELVCIPGRTIHRENVAEARNHAAAVLAACDLLEGK